MYITRSTPCCCLLVFTVVFCTWIDVLSCCVMWCIHYPYKFAQWISRRYVTHPINWGYRLCFYLLNYLSCYHWFGRKGNLTKPNELYYNLQNIYILPKLQYLCNIGLIIFWNIPITSSPWFFYIRYCLGWTTYGFMHFVRIVATFHVGVHAGSAQHNSPSTYTSCSGLIWYVYWIRDKH